MSDVFRTMIIPAPSVVLARKIANMFAGQEQYMWQTGLSLEGSNTATHYISSGVVQEFYQVMAPCQTWELNDAGQWVMTDEYHGDPQTVYEACQAADPLVQCTLEEVEELFLNADITGQNPWAAMSRLGLQMIQIESV